ncbi:hypothetical protein [Fusibacter sp. JL216-2]|uniref:hypothetical protein n=1 Tax=Fusibacter sp. JL216-2 TaxID=3071453 RepID=UPI003D324AFB
MKLSAETKTTENLPYPFVLYPRGAFVVFSKTEEREGYYLCDCMKKSVINYLELRQRTHPNEIRLDTWNFPQGFVDFIWDKHGDAVTGFHDWIKFMDFKKNICHRCQGKKPQVEFCPKSEGTVFRQAYGWYLDMKHYEYGVVPRLQRYLPNMESEKLKELIAYKYVSLKDDILYHESIESLPEISIEAWLADHDIIWSDGEPRVWDPQYPHNFIQALKRELERRKTSVRRYIEDGIRADFEYPPLIGKWKSEQKLYEYVKKLVPKVKIKRNHRSKILDHLEMDIWLPDYKIGIEYQGIQHYEPVKHWGGKRGLEKVQARDLRKKELAMENGIKLLYFHHYEVLSLELVHKKLQPYIDNIKPVRVKDDF